MLKKIKIGWVTQLPKIAIIGGLVVSLLALLAPFGVMFYAVHLRHSRKMYRLEAENADNPAPPRKGRGTGVVGVLRRIVPRHSEKNDSDSPDNSKDNIDE